MEEKQKNTEFEIPSEGVSKGCPAFMDGLRELGARVDAEVQIEGRGQGPNLRLDPHGFSGNH